MKEQIKLIAEHYGYDNQSRQLIEEMAELTVAINKYWRKALFCGRKKIADVVYPMPEEDDIIEEIADVEIMLEQMKIFLACHEEVEGWKKEKIKRQMERIRRNESY